MAADENTILFHSATIITVNNSREVIRNGYIYIINDRIASIGKGYPSNLLPGDTEIIDCKNKIIIPGLINTHAHLVQSLLRGLAEDLPLHNWLCDAIWPLEAVYADDDGYNAAKLTIAEMLKTGTTCFLDPMLTYRAGFERVCDVVGEMGIRGCLGKLVKFIETNRQLSITDPRDKDLIAMSIPALVEAHTAHNGSYDNRLQVWAAAGTPRGAPKYAFQELGDACSEHGISITMHCAEAPRDLEIYRGTYGCSPMEFVEATHLCSAATAAKPRNLVLAHMVNLDLERDIPILASTNTTVAHNPSSNLKLASGIAPVPSMLAHDQYVNVSLGTDGAPCSNHYDMFQEMHLVSILHKGVHNDASLVPAETALEMATINGAKALGLENDIGSLEVGKKADLVILDPYGRGNIGVAPWNPDDDDGEDFNGVTSVTTVVHGCTGRDVYITVVNGRIVVRNGQLADGGCLKEMEIIRKAQSAAKGILRRCNMNRVESQRVGVS
ncbi:guanine deaminase, putative [Talaromyces stipitatus ATCC 10500]|uniref:Guanine deaminase, putative n=1 Tax=Talaromyces stipitatus (strain ATCC 10500 / CBS 375.48 / QM 6759 / NRRL 1006) TaxID=441959 RepID=B8MM78_TALSN|nr:guanine deaminase, putative [Talaromyces stipitatus ATCC 10500]EED13590.1 guanine deaminase, putative [Talaromyces stipitatus ATCC 10500]